MTTTQTTAPAYRVRGTTDEVTTCQQCGKPELKGTVVLDILDADGNMEEVIYVGSTCAAKMTAVRTTGAKIRQEATAADRRRQQVVDHARKIIAHFAPHEAEGPAKLAAAYEDANSGYFWNFPDADPMAMALECMARHRETVATDGLSVLRAA